MRRLVLFVLPFLLLAPGAAGADEPAASADASPRHATWAALGGGHDLGQVTVGVLGGWPRLSLRVQAGVGKGWAPLAEVEATPSWRVEPSLGLGRDLVVRRKGRLAAELLLGWHLQSGVLAQRGPSGVVRFRATATGKVVGCWFALGTRHTLLFDRTRTVSADGTEVAWSARHRWSPHLAGGIAFAVHRNVGFSLGLDWTFVDVGTIAVSLPGIHAGLQIGGP